MTLFVISALFLVALAGLTSAAHPYNTYTYTDRNDFSYNENDNGFRISSTNNEPVARGYTYCGYYDWSYGGKRCARSLANRPYYPDHASYDDYDQDAAIKEAFRTYQQTSKYKYQLEAKRIALEERNRYDHYRYGGYGYGYSGVRYYSYGW